MSSAAATSAQIKRGTGVASMTAYAGAAAFLLAAAWYAVVVAEVVVAAEPRPQPDQSREEWLQTYFGWFKSTLADERFYGGAAIIGFLCLLPTAAFVRDKLEPDRALAKLGAQAVGAGAIIWVVGNVAALGGHHAVGVMTERGDPLETVRLIAWLIDDVDDAFELVGLAVINSVRSCPERQLLQALDAVPELTEPLRAGTREERIYGATSLPNYLRRPYGEGWALVGDAGCHKDPFLALGICDAFRDAELLADAVGAGLSRERREADALAEYERRRNTATRADYEKNIHLTRGQRPPREVLETRARVRGDARATTAYFLTSEDVTEGPRCVTETLA